VKTRFFPTATLAAELDEAWRQSVGNVGKPGGNLGTDGTFLHPQCGGSHVRTALQFVRIFILSYQLTFDDFHARVFDDSGASPNHSKVPDERPPRRHSPPFKPFRIVRIIALPDASLTQTDLSGSVNRELSSRGSLKKRAHLWDDQSTVTMIFLKAAGFSLQDRRATAASSSGTTKLTA